MTAVPKDILLGFTRWTFMRHRTPLWRNAKTSQSWPPRPQRNHAFFGRDPIAGRSLHKFEGMDSEKLFNSEHSAERAVRDQPSVLDLFSLARCLARFSFFLAFLTSSYLSRGAGCSKSAFVLSGVAFVLASSTATMFIISP